MKVLEFCTSQSLGGLELYFTSCCKALSNDHVNVLALVRKASKIDKYLSNEDIRISYVGKQTITDLLSVIRSFKPDIVHVHHKDDILNAALARRLYPHFVYIHTRQMDFPRRKKNPYHTFIYRSMDKIISITERLRKQMIEHLLIDDAKVQTLYYGVPVVERRTDRCESLKVGSHTFNIGVVARLDHKKEQHIVIEAIELLDNPSVQLHLIGDSTDDAYADRLHTQVREKNLEAQVFFHGFVANPQEIMPCFDVIILPTAIETFGLVLPEAMRMGVAVIGANGGGVPEIIEDEKSGLLFTPSDPKSLKNCIIKMMDEKKRSAYALAGKQRADATFEVGHHFNKLIHLFESTLHD